jgi:hypothetical protein
MSEQPWSDDYVVGGEVDSAAPALALVDDTSQVVDFDLTVPLSMDEARELTEHIRSAVDMVYVLIARAHAGRAWEALGYQTFADYVRDEFDISRSRAYQLLNQAKVVEMIEAATPNGTDIHLSEAAARDLKAIIGEVVPEIEDRTRDLPANEAADVVEEIVEDYRGKVRESRERREQDALERDEAEMDAADRRGFSSDSSRGGPESAGGGYAAPPPPPIYDDEDDIDPALIRRNVQAAYDLYSSLTALKAMPDIQSVIDTIPVERRVQINDSLRPATAWLNTLQDAWFAQPWQTQAQGPDDSSDSPDDLVYVPDGTADSDEDFDGGEFDDDFDGGE